MNSIDIIDSEFQKKLHLQFAPEIRAGFPGPAEEYLHESLDFNRDLMTHRDEGYIELLPVNPKYKPIRIDETDNFEVWGVVVYTIKPW